MAARLNGVRVALQCSLVLIGGCLATGPEEDFDPELAEDSVAAAETALLAGLEFADSPAADVCDIDERMVLRNAALLGRAAATSRVIEECIDSRIDLPFYRSCNPKDPAAGQSKAVRVAALLNVVRSQLPGRFLCRTVTGSERGVAEVNEEVITPDGFEDAMFFLSTNTLANVLAGDIARLHSLAATIWHEASHTLGYNDNTSGEFCGLGMPGLLTSCVSDVLAASKDACSGPAACPRGARFGIASPEQVDFGAVTTTLTGTGSCQCIRDTNQFSNPSVDAPSHPVLNANEAGDQYGGSLTSGDFNGDGLDDVAVGAPFEGLGASTRAGAVYTYEGTLAGLYPNATLTQASLDTVESNDEFGFALASSDFNDDGFDDLAIGSPGENGAEGRVFLYRGSASGLVPVRVLTQSGIGANEAGDRFGHALVARRGVFNDGLAVGAPFERVQSNTRQAGFVFVFNGSVAPGQMLAPAFGFDQSGVETNEDGDQFGWSLAAGHISGATTDDLVVGAAGEDGGFGKVYVFTNLSSAGTSYTVQRQLTPPSAAFGFGWSVAVGSFTNVNAEQVAVGAPGSGAGPTAAGAVYVYDAQTIFPDPGPANRLRFTMAGPVLAQLMGSSLQTMFNDSEAFDTLAVGAQGGYSGSVGAVYILKGQSGGMSLRQELSQSALQGDQPEDLFGLAMTRARIVADGRDDLIVGAPGDSRGITLPEVGAMFVYRGVPPSLPLQPSKCHTQAD